MNADIVERLRKLSERQELKPDVSTVLEAATAIKELAAFDIRNLPEGLYTVKNGVVYTAKVKVSGGNVLNMKTGESHWEDDRIVGGEQVFPKRGEWTEENRRPKSSQFVCSICHRTAYDPQPSRDPKWVKRCRYAYCPNCGAKMERGEAET